eukprot:4743345-Pleurochrysis_carterae.AAC.2
MSPHSPAARCPTPSGCRKGHLRTSLTLERQQVPLLVQPRPRPRPFAPAMRALLLVAVKRACVSRDLRVGRRGVVACACVAMRSRSLRARTAALASAAACRRARAASGCGARRCR